MESWTNAIYTGFGRNPPESAAFYKFAASDQGSTHEILVAVCDRVYIRGYDISRDDEAPGSKIWQNARDIRREADLVFANYALRLFERFQLHPSQMGETGALCALIAEILIEKN